MDEYNKSMGIKTDVIHESMRIGGKKIAGDNGNIDVFNPYNGEVVGTVPRASASQVSEAFKIANDFKPKLTRYERQQILQRTANSIVDRNTTNRETLSYATQEGTVR